MIGIGEESSAVSTSPKTDHPDLVKNRPSTAAQLIRSIPLEPIVDSGTSRSIQDIEAIIERRAIKIEDAERVLTTDDFGLALANSWLDRSNTLLIASSVVSADREPTERNRLARSLMEQVYSVLGEDFKLAETNFDPSLPIGEILKKLGRQVDLNTNGYQVENGAMVKHKLQGDGWESITLYDRLPKAETITSKSGEQWALARSTNILSKPLTNIVQYGLSYVRLPRQ